MIPIPELWRVIHAKVSKEKGWKGILFRWRKIIDAWRNGANPPLGLVETATQLRKLATNENLPHAAEYIAAVAVEMESEAHV